MFWALGRRLLTDVARRPGGATVCGHRTPSELIISANVVRRRRRLEPVDGRLERATRAEPSRARPRWVTAKFDRVNGRPNVSGIYRRPRRLLPLTLLLPLLLLLRRPVSLGTIENHVKKWQTSRQKLWQQRNSLRSCRRGRLSRDTSGQHIRNSTTSPFLNVIKWRLVCKRKCE